jgi:hypothetical protein
MPTKRAGGLRKTAGTTPILVPLVPERPAFEIELEGFCADSCTLREDFRLTGSDPRPQGLGNPGSHILLYVKHLIHRPVIRFGPEIRVLIGIDEVRGDPDEGPMLMKS